MKVKKIIIFFPIFSKGGLEKVANALVSHFNNYELKIYFITFKKNKYLNFKNKNVKILCSKSASKKKSTSSFKKIFYCLKILQKLLKMNNPENTNILSIQNSACAIILAKFYNYKIVVHNGAPLSSFLYLKNIFKSFFVFIFKIISYNFADKIIVNSNANGNSLSKFILNKKKVIKIHNPINLNKKPFITAKKKQILTVCRLVHEKGIHVLINAFHKINDPELKLIIVGDGAYKKNLINLVFHLNLKKKVIFTGWVENPDKYYSESSLFILPSFFEGFGNVLVEAMNFNIPCISTVDSGGPKEILGNGKYGYLVKKNNSEELTNKIKFCFKNKKITKTKVIAAKKSLKRFDINYCTAEYLKVLNSV